jgi:hypothetical protein
MASASAEEGVGNGADGHGALDGDVQEEPCVVVEPGDDLDFGAVA